MAQSYLIFDFGGNEEVAQQARHKLEGWKQAFRLGNKVQLKFERASAAKAASSAPAKETAERIRMLVRLDFSGHEKLSHQRWLDRIPAEEPFKSAMHQVVKPSDPTHAATVELFDSLDSGESPIRATRK